MAKYLKALPQGLKFSDRYICKYDGTRYEEPEPHLFSFNSPFGACPTCQGFGNTIGIDYGLVIPNPLLSLKDGAIEPFTRPQHAWAQKELVKYAESASIDMKRAVRRSARFSAKLHHLWRRRLARDKGLFPVARNKESTSCTSASFSPNIAAIRDAPIATASVCGKRPAM